MPSEFRLAPLTSEDRVARDQNGERTRTDWLVAVSIEAPAHRPSDLRGLGELIRVAAQGITGSGLKWDAPIRWLRPSPSWNRVTEAEVAALFPDRWLRTFLDERRAPGSCVVPIGRTSQGELATVEVPAGEGRHLCLLGETGMGKSTALVALALHAARDSNVILFDPIGDTARTFLRFLPRDRQERVLRISAIDAGTTLNALEGLREESSGDLRRERARFDLVTALRRVRAFRYGDVPFWGPRVEEVLGRALQAAATLPQGTLVDASLLLEGRMDPTSRRSDRGAASATEELLDLARFRPDEVDGTRRLLAELTGNRALRTVLCARVPTHRPRDLVASRRLVVVSGDTGTLGELTARYLLAVCLAIVWSELAGRPPTSKTFLVLDEAQWYAHESAAEILRLGRRSNVHLYLATQALGSLPESVREALLTNAADYLLFRGSPEDAREFARWQGEIDANELLALDRGEAMFLAGKGRRFARIRTTDLPAPADPREREAPETHTFVDPARSRDSRREPGARPDREGGEVDVDDLLGIAAELAGAAATFDFPFARIRRTVDPAGLVVRELGRRLQRSGALKSRRHQGRDPTWELDTGRVRSAFPAPVDPTRHANALARWSQIVDLASTGREPF